MSEFSPMPYPPRPPSLAPIFLAGGHPPLSSEGREICYSLYMVTPDGKKWCPRCKQEKPVDEFSPDRYKADGYAGKCKPCGAEYARERYRKSAAVRERASEYYRETIDARRAYAQSAEVKGKNWARRNSAKVAAFKVYGGCCTRCGSTEYLQFDHVNNDGAEHRRVESWRDMIFRIARLGEPIDDYELQLLCLECHREKTVSVWRKPTCCPHCGGEL